MSKKSLHYDIIFVGWGASTCILIIEMEKKSLLKGKKILIIEPSDKLENDKTFCFWANRNDEIFQSFKSIISKSWTSIRINDNQSSKIHPIEYFHVDSIDLYDWTREISSKFKIEHSKEKVLSINESETLLVNTKENNYSSSWIFDSRPPDFTKISNDNFNISQSFFGLKVKLKETTLDSNVYHMMDFRIPQEKATQFVYILPYSSTSALIELTRFGKEIINNSDAKKELDRFISKYFGSYEILDEEKGIIPMSSNLPEQASVKNWVNIGTRAGNVKPSTGYAFKNMYRHAQLICEGGNIKSKKVKPNKRFLFYDQLLLIILTVWPLKGKPIFERLFAVKSSYFILRFLDEKTSFFEDLSMFYKLQIGVFIKSIFYWIYWKFKKIIFPLLIIIYVIFDHSSPSAELLNLSSNNLYVLTLGLLFIGIPHGALDHLTGSLDNNTKINVKFVFYYLLMMIPILLIWFWIPVLGLIFFLIYSAWHFGQTEINNWGIESNLIGFLWGCILFSSIFLIHYVEFLNILSMIDINILKTDFNYIMLGNTLLILPLIAAVSKRNLEWVLIVVFLYLSNYESLLLTFGLYFIFQHSKIGWMHLKKNLQKTHFNMFMNALPFNIGAIFLYLVFIYLLDLEMKQCLAYFFIFLSAISFPHVICMHLFYKYKT